MRISRSLLHNAAFLLALALVGLLAWHGQRTSSAVLDSNEAVRRSLELISAIKEARSAMQDVETGARGFVLTARESYLEPFRNGRAAWGKAGAQLEAALQGRSPPREEWLAELRRTGAMRIAIAERSIAYRRGHALEASANYSTGMGGKRAMDHIRDLLRELELEERQRLAASQIAIGKRYDDARRALTFGGLVVVALLLASFLAINLNLRTRKQLQERTREQRAFLRTVVDTTPSLIYVRGADGRFELCNAAFARSLGSVPAAMEGRTPEELGVAGIAAALCEGDRDIAAGRRKGFQDEVVLRDAAGRERWFQRTKAPLLLHGGACKSLTVAIDISERRQVERMKSEFVSTVSHELRTPLTAIRGSLGLLVSGAAGDVGPDARTLLDIAHNSCERLVRLINDLLDIEKLDSGRVKLQRRPVRLRGALEEAAEQNSAYARQHDVSIELAIEGDPWAEADPDRFAQVLSNLLSNAAKHSPPGSTIRVDARRSGDMVTIGVRDHGSGVPAAFRARIFDRFAQADSSDARQRGGTGLGLAISRSLVEQHGGTIGFEDAPGGGTRFHFTLPLAMHAAQQVAPQDEQGDETAVLLLVDDQEESARELEAILRRPGYRCVVAGDAAAALSTLGAEPVEAVLVNMALRSSDPLAFIRELRTLGDFRHLPVIAVGANLAGDQERTAGAAIGIGDWLRKPFDAGRVIDAVRSCLAHDTTTHVLHVEDDEDLRAMVAGLLAHDPIALHGAGTLAEARAALAARHHGLVILDLMLPDGDGADLLGELAAARPPTRVIIFTARDSELPESTVILRRLVKSQHGGPELAALVHAQLRHWPRPVTPPSTEQPGGSA